jgi:hypothetical protein
MEVAGLGGKGTLAHQMIPPAKVAAAMGAMGMWPEMLQKAMVAAVVGVAAMPLALLAHPDTSASLTGVQNNGYRRII